jgi:hypothetical protein
MRNDLEIYARQVFAFEIAFADLSNQLTALPFDYSALQLRSFPGLP